MPKNKRPKKSHHRETAKRVVVGLQFGWSDHDPLKDVDGATQLNLSNTTHTNAYLRHNVDAVIKKFGVYIFNTVFKWRIDIDAICNDGKQEYTKGVVIDARCKFGQLNEHVLSQVESIYPTLNMKHYKHFEFTAECIGK